MAKELVLVSHGRFCEELKASTEMIMGPQESIHTVALLPEEGPEDFTAKFEATQLLPSPGIVDVTNKLLNLLLEFINCIFVLKVLKVSDIGDFGFLKVINSFFIIFYLPFCFQNYQNVLNQEQVLYKSFLYLQLF